MHLWMAANTFQMRLPSTIVSAVPPQDQLAAMRALVVALVSAVPLQTATVMIHGMRVISNTSIS